MASPAILTLFTPHALTARTISKAAPSFRGSAKAAISQPNIRCDGARSPAAAVPSVGWALCRADRIRRVGSGARAAGDSCRVPRPDAGSFQPRVSAGAGYSGRAPAGDAGGSVWPAPLDRGWCRGIVGGG